MAPGGTSGNPADRRHAPPRLGWRFSLFAAVCAAVVDAYIERFQPIATQLAEGVPLVALAFAAARLAGWLAAWTGGRDYGIRAGAFTLVLFSLGVSIMTGLSSAAHRAEWLADPLAVLNHLTALSLIVGTVALVPCLVGSLLFQGAVLVSARLTAKRARPTGSG